MCAWMDSCKQLHCTLYFTTKSNCISYALHFNFKKSVECEIDIWFSRAEIVWLQPPHETTHFLRLVHCHYYKYKSQQQITNWKYYAPFAIVCLFACMFATAWTICGLATWSNSNPTAYPREFEKSRNLVGTTVSISATVVQLKKM